jgi:hypothetical protein
MTPELVPVAAGRGHPHRQLYHLRDGRAEHAVSQQASKLGGFPLIPIDRPPCADDPFHTALAYPIPLSNIT